MNSKNVNVAVTGAIWWLPEGDTTEVNGLTDLYDVPTATNLGFVNDSGVTIGDESSREWIKAWQNGARVRQITSEVAVNVTASFIENTPEVRQLFFRAVEDVDGALLWKPANILRGRAVIDVIDPEGGDETDGSVLKLRYVMDNVTIDSTEGLTFASGNAIEYGITFSATPDANGVVSRNYAVITTPDAPEEDPEEDPEA